MNDPGHPDLASGEAPSYQAVHTARDVYVEYADGEREYHGVRRDPGELDDAIGRVPAGRLDRLEATPHRLDNRSGPDRR